jgi:hypothetical protein
MAPCCYSCLLAGALIISMIYMMNATRKSQIMEKYNKQLSPELQKTYIKIVEERTCIYYTGYAIGFILSIFIILYNIQIKKSPMSTGLMVSTVIIVSFFVNYFYYVLSPKSDWMLKHVRTAEENKAWLEMYRGMQTYYHGGLVLGLAAAGMFAFAFRC